MPPATSTIPAQASEAAAIAQEQAAALAKLRGRRQKYGAVKTEYNGVTYDSKAEAAYARELDVRKAAGDVLDWGRAGTISLVPGKRADAVTYRPDFWVISAQNGNYFVDVKGVETPVFKLKARLLRHFHPDYRLLIVTKDGERWLP